MSKDRFAFGKNWRDYIEKNFSPERVETSKRHIQAFSRRSDFKDVRIIDIGCGSGLHSLAMWQLGAREIVSFDYDADSVGATQLLHRYAGEPGNWRVMQGSVLDRPFLATLGRFDFVYSWGVLHHTGEQWTAIRNAASMIAPGGEFYVALYTSDGCVDPTPEFWIDLKKRYINADWATKRRLELWYIWRFDLNRKVNRASLGRLAEKIRTYRTKRGMSFYHDLKDWLGGYPMEFSAAADVTRFATEELGLTVIDIATGQANIEYLFGQPAVAAARSALARQDAIVIPGPPGA